MDNNYNDIMLNNITVPTMIYYTDGKSKEISTDGGAAPLPTPFLYKIQFKSYWINKEEIDNYCIQRVVYDYYDYVEKYLGEYSIVAIIYSPTNEIVGCCDLKIMGNQFAKIDIFVSNGFGKYLLKFIHKWMIQTNCKYLFLNSTQEASLFYIKQGFNSLHNYQLLDNVSFLTTDVEKIVESSKHPRSLGRRIKIFENQISQIPGCHLKTPDNDKSISKLIQSYRNLLTESNLSRRLGEYNNLIPMIFINSLFNNITNE